MRLGCLFGLSKLLVNVSHAAPGPSNILLPAGIGAFLAREFLKVQQRFFQKFPLHCFFDDWLIPLPGHL
jgi:hypothetical protein